MTITKLRQDLFRLADQAMAGELVEFTHRGVVFRLLPESRPSKLDGLVGQPVVAPGTDLAGDSRALLEEMRAEWERDWAEL